jgi:hypothetical protein
MIDFERSRLENATEVVVRTQDDVCTNPVGPVDKDTPTAMSDRIRSIVIESQAL